MEGNFSAEDQFQWKATFGERALLAEGQLGQKGRFGGKDTIQWKTTFGEWAVLVEGHFWQKASFGGRPLFWSLFDEGHFSA